MADKPLYYGGSKSGPAYYGKGPAYYGAGSSYYGGGPAYYGGNGGGAGGAGGDEGSLVGTLTVGRMIRVVSQRWLSVFVFLLVGLVVSFAVYRISPTVYEAVSEFTIDMRRSSGSRGTGALAQVTPDFGSTYAEIFNTRISDWRSEKVVAKIVQQYHRDHPSSTVSDAQLISTLGGSTLELQRNSRIIMITVRSGTPALAAALANCYAVSIDAFTEEENKLRCDKAVSQIHRNVEAKRREVDKIAKQLLDFRTANKVDNLRSSRDTIQQGLSKTTGDILGLETQETQLQEWEKLLSSVQKDPATFGSLSTGVPRAQEIATEYRAYQDAESEYQTLLVTYTDQHPQVVVKRKSLDVARQRFLDAATRALLTGRTTLRVVRNQLMNLRTKQEDLRNELASVEQRIVLAESGLGQIEADFGVANRVLEGLILDENKARLEAEGNNEIVRVGRKAPVPTEPVLPKPELIFGAGIAVAIALGLAFVLIMDNLEDTVVNLSDIEGRLALKVLAVLPHVRRKKREEVAKFSVEDKYSQFSEAVAGLRNLLDSPRYEALSHCILVISTQPGEGKTITSTSLAIAYAQAGKKTLHVDFDLRRPRVAHVWDLKLTAEHSFSHALQKDSAGEPVDFAKLVQKSDVPSLSVIGSLPPDGVTPAAIFGSSIVQQFFDWARANFDHIIVDSPPFGLVGDVVSLAVVADSVLIMCCPDRTHFKPIQFCSRSLAEAGANVLGVVVNDVETSSSAAFSPSRKHSGYGGYGKYGDSYGGYGYGYGYGYGSDYAPKHKHKKKAKLIAEKSAAKLESKPSEKPAETPAAEPADKSAEEPSGEEEKK